MTKLLASALAFCLLLFASAASAQIDSPRLTAALESGEYGFVKSLLIQRGDERLYEQYFLGANGDELHLLNSVTKSVGATLLGVAIRRNQVSIDASIDTYFPSYPWHWEPMAANQNLTLRDILSMRTGLQWDEWSTPFTDPSNSFAQMFQSPDWYLHVLSLPRVAPANSTFTYNTGASILMSGVLRQATGAPPQDLLGREVFEPLGIDDWRFEIPFGFTNFPYGDAPLGVGLWLRPADMLKLGRMLLDGGSVGDKRIIDQAWIKQMFTRYNHAGNEEGFADDEEVYGYGYQWWYAGLVDARGREHPVWYAHGAGRQFLMIFPQLDLILASTAEDYNARGPGVFDLLREQILPTMDLSITAALSGSYYNPATSGEGLNVEVLADRNEVLAYWYTQENGAQRFYVLQGEIDGDVANLQVYTTVGGNFQDPQQRPQLQPAGQATLRWNSCTSAVLDYDIELGSGSYALTRLSGQCADPGPLPQG